MSAPLEKPRVVFVTAENRCNLKCKSCAIWEDMAETDDNGEPRLAEDEMFRLIDKVKDWGGVQHVAFDTIGEPLLDKSFEQYVAHANRLGFGTPTVTNGMPLTEARAMEVLKSGLQYISFSIDSPVAEIHDEIRGQAGAFEKTVRAIRLLQRLKTAHLAPSAQNRPAIMIICVVSRNNFREVDQMAELVRDLGVTRLRLVYAATVDSGVTADLAQQSTAKANVHSFGLPAENLHIDAGDRSLLLEKLGLLACKCNTYQIGLDLAINAANVRRPCPVLWTSTFVDKFGNVYPCPMMTDTHLGNIRHKSLDEIWNGEEYAKLRDLLSRRNSGQVDLEICERCCTFSRIVTREPTPA
jgi:radical SAM protein with 4Fe4S-binding SPASM domain